MVKVFYTDISSLNTNTINVKILSKSRGEYLKTITDEKRYYQSLLTWKLLEYALNRLGIKFDDFVRDFSGKWRAVSGEFDFSISHSLNVLAVAISEGQKVGIDVEKCSERIFRVKRRLVDVMPDISEEEKIELLTTKWTEIESEYKFGLEDGKFTSIKVSDLSGENFILTVCTGDDEVGFEKIDIKNCL